MHIWTIETWEEVLKDVMVDVKTGLHLRFDQDVDVEVKRACKEFCKWLRKEYYFPKLVRVYIKASPQIKTINKELVSATIWLPDNIKDTPFIRVSTGEYFSSILKVGKDNALAGILGSIAHELTHYFQWINGIELTPIGMERQATSYAGYIIQEYSETREHP